MNQPLLNDSDEDLPAARQNGDVLFKVDDEDDSDENENGVLVDTNGHADQGRPGVRFQEEVQVIVPPLRSTMQSRETGA